MALDLRGFTIPEQDFGGLYNLTNKLERKTAMEQRAAEEAKAKRAASSKFFTNYLDDKEKFTGTKYDPVNHELLADALHQSMDLINQGVEMNDVLQSISPLVNKVGKYTMAAQKYAEGKKQALANMKGVAGVDLQKLGSEMDRMAFSGKDVSDVDPTLDYADMALRSGDVYNTEGFDEMKQKSKWLPNSATIKTTDRFGKTIKSKVKTTAPEYAISETDADGNHIGFVPKYEVATEAGNELIHDFQTDNGIVKAPIRLLDKDIFYSMPKANQAMVRKEAMKYAEMHGVEPTSKQVENFARAIAYDQLKGRSQGSYETIEETKQAPAPRITVNVAGSRADQRAAVTKNDLYKALDETPVDQNGQIEITPLTGGISYLKNSRGKQMSQPSLLFNPKTKEVTYTDPETNESETVSLSKFKSMAKSNNSKEDLDYLEFLRNYDRDSDKTIDTDAPAKSAINKTIEKVMNMFNVSGGKKTETKSNKSPEEQEYSDLWGKANVTTGVTAAEDKRLGELAKKLGKPYTPTKKEDLLPQAKPVEVKGTFVFPSGKKSF